MITSIDGGQFIDAINERIRLAIPERNKKLAKTNMSSLEFCEYGSSTDCVGF